MSITKIFEASNDTSSVAMTKIISYLNNKLDFKLLKVPGVEPYKNSNDSGFGIRYIIDGTTNCIRFNWYRESSVGKSSEISSIDMFTGKHDPSHNIHTKGISLVKSLPALVGILANPKFGKQFVFPVDAKVAVNESLLVEAKRDDFTSEEALADFVTKLLSGKTYTRSDFINSYHIVHAGIFDTVFRDFSDKVTIKQKQVSLKPGTNLADLQDSILAKAGVLEVTRGGTKETYLKNKQEEELEEETEEKVPFVDTLDHLEGLVTGVIKGAFNALFVAGKGGVGKTQTVERVLESHGLQDGDGYFKNTGSASAAGVYTLLYHHRKDIILFDDSDGALADIDARNLIKAATDTKKRRKMVWNKKSSFIFDPATEDPEAYEDDLAMAPKYFDFEGRIIFISNLPLNKLDPDGALRTRAFVINVNPTDDEMFDYMGNILHDIKLEDGLKLSKTEKEHVLEIVKSSKRKSGVSIRKLVRALNLAASGAANWEKLVELYC